MISKKKQTRAEVIFSPLFVLRTGSAVFLIVLTMGKIPIIGCEIIVDCMPVEFDLAA